MRSIMIMSIVFNAQSAIAIIVTAPLAALIRDANFVAVSIVTGHVFIPGVAIAVVWIVLEVVIIPLLIRVHIVVVLIVVDLVSLIRVAHFAAVLVVTGPALIPVAAIAVASTVPGDAGVRALTAGAKIVLEIAVWLALIAGAILAWGAASVSGAKNVVPPVVRGIVYSGCVIAANRKFVSVINVRSVGR